MAVTHYVYDGQNVHKELDGNGAPQAAYTYEPNAYGSLISQHRGSSTSYYHQDALGSIRELTDASETRTDTYAYSAWGESLQQTGSTINPFRWIGNVGYYFDEEMADYYVRARYYQSDIGRWISPDPLGFVDGANLYSAYFVPSLIDPSGMIGCDGNKPYANCDAPGCPPMLSINIKIFRWNGGKDRNLMSNDISCLNKRLRACCIKPLVDVETTGVPIRDTFVRIYTGIGAYFDSKEYLHDLNIKGQSNLFKSPYHAPVRLNVHYVAGFVIYSNLNRRWVINKSVIGVAHQPGVIAAIGSDSTSTTLAHEVGHNLSLGHVDTWGNLMHRINYYGNTDLTIDQCEQMRSHILSEGLNV